MSEIEAIITQLRVPDLPYPVGRRDERDGDRWGNLLEQCWREQIDATVVRILRQGEDRWSNRQVNAAYLADRIMDVFLRTSGLHISLIRRVARLRFFLAWQLERSGAEAVAPERALRRWLDHLIHLRGWSDGEGRSAKRLLQRLDDLIEAVATAFGGDEAPLEGFVSQWFTDHAQQEERNARLQQRLFATEQGAARQRAADLQSLNRVARALSGHRLPAPILELIENRWQSLLRHLAYEQGMDSEPWKQATRAMDWLIWAMDPTLSDDDRNRLYQVGEELPERLGSIWSEAYSEPFPAALEQSLQQHLIARLRGEPLEWVAAGERVYDTEWLQPPALPQTVLERVGQWFVTGEGTAEQRRWLFACFETSGEVLWTNGQGVKQGQERAQAVADAIAAGTLQALPDPQLFDTVLNNTVTGLSRVLEAQQKQRQLALERARAEAERLRRERAVAERQAAEIAEAEARRLAERDAERKKAALQEKLAQDQEEETQRARDLERRRSELLARVDQVRLGGWIELQEDAGPLRLKLAVRINASGKLIFVDRLGLNRREINRQALVATLLEGRARILNEGAEFEDTLSRVVGRIRVGR